MHVLYACRAVREVVLLQKRESQHTKVQMSVWAEENKNDLSAGEITYQNTSLCERNCIFKLHGETALLLFIYILFRLSLNQMQGHAN